TPYPDNEATLAKVYDQLAHDAMSGRVTGSSADGEQPKFSTRVVDTKGDVREVLVKFSPPRGTPFGERWNDLLHAEAIATDVLRDHGFAVPITRIIRSEKRTYFESARIDRIGATGRQHLLPLYAVHAAFNPGAQQHWASSIAQLAAQKRIAYDAVATTQTLYAFGQLIGNTDMHFGNLGVVVESPQEIAKGRFTLAPCYDMLPMRFAPGAHSDLEYAAFNVELSAALPDAIAKIARTMASEFWKRASRDQSVSIALRSFAVNQ
ncbi:MAG: HipA domain-containing protein, partial [Casimicrobium sp.]